MKCCLLCDALGNRVKSSPGAKENGMKTSHCCIFLTHIILNVLQNFAKSSAAVWRKTLKRHSLDELQLLRVKDSFGSYIYFN
jgi:hypothetical protein